jgi:hypothetical protein
MTGALKTKSGRFVDSKGLRWKWKLKINDPDPENDPRLNRKKWASKDPETDEERWWPECYLSMEQESTGRWIVFQTSVDFEVQGWGASELSSCEEFPGFWELSVDEQWKFEFDEAFKAANALIGNTYEEQKKFFTLSNEEAQS